MNTQHTPGPWRYARGNGSPTTGEHMIAGATPGYLAEVRDVGSGSVVANARLIAAAPDLLAALEETLESLLAHLRQAHRNTPGETYLNEHPAVISARAAIARAKSET